MAAEAAAVAGRLSTARDSGILDLSNCKLVQIPPSIYVFIKDTDVTKCDLSNNELRTLPPKLFQYLTKATDLNLSNNLMHTLSDDVIGLKHLQNLNVSSNNWTEIPDGVFRIETLRELKLQDNKIEEIDTEQLHYLVNLQRLSLEENVLSYETLEALTEFQASHEHIIITW